MNSQMRRDVVVGEAGVKGLGVFARRDFARGEFIFRRRHGRVVANRDILSLSEEEQRHLCELDFETCAVLLPPGCYLNHSCDPNAIRSGVNVYAWREIHAGEEITIDYRLNAHDGERWVCACGAADCPGYVIGDFFSLDAAHQRAYLPYAPRFIRKEYRRRMVSACGSARQRND
jgi:[histone H3]-lysine36 N-trimethyltransferase